MCNSILLFNEIINVYIVIIMSTNTNKKQYGCLGFFGNKLLYRLRYVDKCLGEIIYLKLKNAGYNCSRHNNNKAIELEISVSHEANVFFLTTIKTEKLKRNIKRDQEALKQLTIDF